MSLTINYRFDHLFTIKYWYYYISSSISTLTTIRTTKNNSDSTIYDHPNNQNKNGNQNHQKTARKIRVKDY